MKREIVLACALFCANQALAQGDLQWLGFRAEGSGEGELCQSNPNSPHDGNVNFVSMGLDGAWIFRSFRLNLPGGDPGIATLRQSSRCLFDSRVRLPAGRFIQALTQTICSGVVKSAGSEGRFSTDAYIFQNQIPITALDVRLGRNHVFTNAQECWSQDHAFSLQDAHLQCSQSRRFAVDTTLRFAIQLKGARDSVAETFLLNVDSLDFRFQLHPELGDCDALPPLPPPPTPRPGTDPNRPSPTVPTPTPTPVGTPPTENPTPQGVKLSAEKRTALVPSQGASCWLNRGQSIFVEKAPDPTRYSATVILRQVPPNCPGLVAGSVVTIFTADFKVRR